RPGYAMGREPGLLICSWPRGNKPTLPFVYSDEVWTGNEYQVASHLIHEGLVEEGLTIVKALRSRYDGRTRNPWNEYECGNWYARAMSSYALLGALSGFRYSGADKTVWFGPRIRTRPFQCFFSTASGWGTIGLRDSAVQVRIIEGELAIAKLVFREGDATRNIDWNVTVHPGAVATRAV
ncbi:MAG: GH116 family glycosyl hydrolase, partial [Terracidiphilus sp.]